MLTSSFALTATERVLPKLALNFTTATLDSRVTFTRALATATRTNASGLIETVAADTPRFDYDPITLACKGLLVEETRTNICIQSGNVTSPSWGTTLIGIATIPIATANYAIAPDGTTTASRYVMQLNGSTSTADLCTVYQSIPVVGTTVYSLSVWMKTADGATKTVSVRDDTKGIVNTLAIVTGTWQRFLFTGTASSSGLMNFKIWLRGGVGTSDSVDLLIWGAQLEVGAFATSYIPTTTTSLTRNADVAAITGTNFSDFWQAGKGGALVQAIPSTVASIRPLVQFDDGTANEIIALRGNTTNPELYIVDGGTPQAQIDAGTIAANTPYSLTGWWDTNNCKARKDSGAVVTDTTATIPTVTQMRIGSDGTNYLNGTLATINYYDKFSSQIYTRRKNKAVFSLL